MKIERDNEPFKPIVITIESLKELQWMYAIANTSVSTGYKEAHELGYTIDKEHAEQFSSTLWFKLDKYREEIKIGC